MAKRWMMSAMMACWLAAVGGPADAADSAVVLVYHHFDDDRVAALDTTSAQLAIAELKAGGFTVLPLPEIVAARAAGRPLPDKAVAITVDEASRGFLDRAWPQFRAARLPVTLFVATDEIDRGGETLSWAELRGLAAEGVTIASQGAARLRLPRVAPDLAIADLARARARFEKELGAVPTLFAWPGGEGSLDAAALVARAGQVAAFGEQSGALWRDAEAF